MADVVVAGGGVIGLTAAIRLREAGAAVELWSPVDPLDTVSAVAAAVWFPTRMESDPRVLAWAAASYTEFRRQADAGVPGVLMRPTRNIGFPGTRRPWWAAAAGQVTQVAGEVRFVAPLTEMGTYLPWLRDRFVAAGGVVVRRRAGRLAEALAVAPVVVNATGLAAGKLCGDPAVRPARGQVVLVENPGVETSVRTAGGAYVHPRSRDVVCGGTYELDNWDTAPDPALSDRIMDRCVGLVPELAGARRTGVKVGLRPVRDGGPRVEAEPAGGGTVVHAYGHGGAGMTLSWGCADEVAALCAGVPFGR